MPKNFQEFFYELLKDINNNITNMKNKTESIKTEFIKQIEEVNYSPSTTVVVF